MTEKLLTGTFVTEYDENIFINKEHMKKRFEFNDHPSSGANTWGYISRGWSTEYHICYYISKCSSWPVVFKIKRLPLGKPGITPVFKMASKTAASYRNDPPE